MKVKTDIRILLNSSLAALKKREGEINKLNVFPVPDGDTGTNMAHTVQSALKEVQKIGDTSTGAVSRAITYGSLMGARGNSGVILSQIIKGACEVIEKSEKVSPRVVAEALKNGSRVAHQAVNKPVEGTMLTVIEDMAKAAESVSGNGIHLVEMLGHVIEEGKRSVERTPFLLPVLKEAGVVDAGGFGLVVMAQGILTALNGNPIEELPIAASGMPSVTHEKVSGGVEESIEYAYCTEFLLKSGGIDMKSLEAELGSLGDSMLVVGTPELTRIHIHTNDPGKVIHIATSLGSISDVQINNIIEQAIERVRTLREGSAGEAATATVGVVAVANGDGIKEILLNLGVDMVVSGGQSMNPSTADILEAVDSIKNHEVIILPNNKNIIMAARQVPSLTEKNVSVLPTTSVPEAFAALLALDRESSLDENIDTMAESFNEVKTGEITYAVRDAADGGFKKDDFIGLYDGEIKISGEDLLATTIGLLREMIDEDDEVMTILAGGQVGEDLVAKLSEMLQDHFPDVEFEIHDGGQPVYHFIIGIE